MATNPSRTPPQPPIEEVSRYAEVVEVFKDERHPPPSDARSDMKAGAAEITRRLEVEVARLLDRAQEILHQPVNDLLSDVLKPWCLEVAAVGVGCKPEPRYARFAEDVFQASAFPGNAQLQDAASESLRELNTAIGGTNRIAVQAFVALTTSVPALLAGTCALLASHPDQWGLLRENPALGTSAVEEGLRLGGLPALVFRPGPTALLIETANHDPAIFTQPDEFRIDRASNPHLAFGRGPHSCVGAHLVRSIACEFLLCLVSTASAIRLNGPLIWKGVAMRYLEHLPVQLELCERAAKMTLCPPGSNTPISRIP